MTSPKIDAFRYAPEAYAFVSGALDFCVSRLPERRHVSAYELLVAVREFGERQFGCFGGRVLESWGVRTADDVGEIVYELIARGYLNRDSRDRREDFSLEFDFNSHPEDFRPAPSPDAECEKIDKE